MPATHKPRPHHFYVSHERVKIPHVHTQTSFVFERVPLYLEGGNYLDEVLVNLLPDALRQVLGQFRLDKVVALGQFSNQFLEGSPCGRADKP